MDLAKKKTLINKFGLGFILLLLLLLFYDFSRQGIYSSKLGINLAVMGDSTSAILLIRPQEGLLSWVRLPDNLSIKIVGSEAFYSVASLWSFGVLERNTYEIVGKSLSGSLGVVIPRVIKVRGEATPENVLSHIHKLSLQTDLSLRDRWLFRKDMVNYISSKKNFGACHTWSGSYQKSGARW